MAERILAAVLGISIALAGCSSCEREDEPPARVGPPVQAARGHVAPRDAGGD